MYRNRIFLAAWLLIILLSIIATGCNSDSSLPHTVEDDLGQ